MDEYINRKALLAEIAVDHGDWLSCNDTDELYRQGVEDNYSDTIRLINEMPAADVQPVKRGHWICEFYNDVFDVYQADCSACKRESTNKYDKVSESYEYCPHCGARMDGGTNE